MDKIDFAYLISLLLFTVIAVFPLSRWMEAIAYTSAAMLLIYAYRHRCGDN